MKDSADYLMWTCPECEAELVQKNLRHSCGDYTVEGFLHGRSERVVRLFWFFIDQWKQFGEVKLHPVKTSVSLMVKVRFARVNRVKSDSIVCHLWLKERVESEKFFKIERLGTSDYIHHFELADEAFLDNEFRALMKMAYEVGKRERGSTPSL